MIPTLTFAALITLASTIGRAAGPFPEPHNNEANRDAQPLAPTEAVKRFQMPPGFEVTLFAAEPDVRNPIGMAWDDRGRLWIAENYTYAGGKDRFDHRLRDRVLVLRDENGDGRADSRKVFTDRLQTLTSVETGRGGIWVMCPPQLLFIPDHDGDAVPDGPPVVKLDGFTVAQANYHNFANGLRWGPDGWLYGRCGHSCPGLLGKPGTPDIDRYPIKGGIWRYHPDREVVEVLTHGTTNPWGHDWNRHGELFFINTVNGHLWHGIHGAHFKESFGADPNPLVYERLDMHADHWHFDTTGSWTASRDGRANEHGGGHAHIGMMIYQGDRWPERFRNRLFTLNMHGRRSNVERLDRHGNGYIGRHQEDVFLMGDPWFRGIDIQQGPDGDAYLIDWSDTGECHDHTGVHRQSGRIYRVRHATSNTTVKGSPPPPAWLDSDIWHEQRLRSRADAHVNPAALDEAGDPVARLRLLWMLHRAGDLEAGRIEQLLRDPDEHLRSWAIRLFTDNHPIDTIYGPRRNFMPPPVAPSTFRRLLEMARNEPSGLVRLTLASTLQRLPLDRRTTLAAALAARAEDAGDHNQPSMIWFALTPLVDARPDALVTIARTTRWPTLLRWIARSLATQSKPLNDLLTALTPATPPIREAVLEGLHEGLLGLRQAPRPAAWPAFSETFQRVSLPPKPVSHLQALDVVFGDGRALAEIRRLVLDQQAEMAARQAGLRTLIDNRAPDLRQLCESLLQERLLNSIAVKGLTLFDDDELGEAIAASYRRFGPDERPAVIEALVSRPAWAKALLRQMAAGRIAKEQLSAFQARQIRSHDDDQLNADLARVWGEIRESDAARRQLIQDWKRRLSSAELANADLRKGRQLYRLVCATCHTLYGEGGRIGPDLTGSGRADLDYLLDNIADPSAVVSADYQVTILTLKDGRTLTGIIVTEVAGTLTLQQATERTTLPKEDIAGRKTSTLSMMPDGLLQALQPTQVRDLIAYLQSPHQVPLPD